MCCTYVFATTALYTCNSSLIYVLICLQQQPHVFATTASCMYSYTCNISLIYCNNSLIYVQQQPHICTYTFATTASYICNNSLIYMQQQPHTCTHIPATTAYAVGSCYIYEHSNIRATTASYTYSYT
jgi:hypothetical protein